MAKANVDIRPVGPEAAPTVLRIARAAFSTRPPLDPPADALRETEETVADALAAGGGLVASYGEGRDVGALILDPQGSTLWLRRVGVLPEVRDHGVATALVADALDRAEQYADVAVLAREELPQTSRFWREHGFVPTGTRAPYVELRRPAPRSYDAPDAASMRKRPSGAAPVSARSGSATMPTSNEAPGARCSAMSPPLLT